MIVVQCRYIHCRYYAVHLIDTHNDDIIIIYAFFQNKLIKKMLKCSLLLNSSGAC